MKVKISEGRNASGRSTKLDMTTSAYIFRPVPGYARVGSGSTLHPQWDQQKPIHVNILSNCLRIIAGFPHIQCNALEYLNARKSLQLPLCPPPPHQCLTSARNRIPPRTRRARVPSSRPGMSILVQSSLPARIFISISRRL